MSSTDVFQHGVASGDPLPDGVVLWTHVTHPEDDALVAVRWEVAMDPDFTRVVASGEAWATPEADGTVHVDVRGLAPATRHHYRFSALGEVSPVGRTRTLPTAGAGDERLRFAFTSCAKFNAGWFNAYDRIADRDDLDLVLHLGDYVYEASNTPPASQTPGADIGRPFEPRHECVTLEDYRARYRQYHRDPSVQRLRAAHPLVCAIDDHELADGAWAGGAAEHRDEWGPWTGRLATALRAREEWMPIRRPDPEDATRVHRRVGIGGLADLFVLDTRSRRDEPVAGDACHDPRRSALGAEQRDWLLDELPRSTARWRLLANPSVLSSTYHPDLDPELLEPLRKLKLVDPATADRDHDQWDGYAAERADLVAAIADAGPTVVLSGDIHVGMVAEVRRDPWGPATDDPAVAIELVTPSVTSQNLDDKLGYGRGGSAPAEGRFVATHPHVRWCDFDSHGYVVVDLDGDRLEATWWAVDDVLVPCDGEAAVAGFSVARDDDGRAVGGALAAQSSAGTGWGGGGPT